MEARELRIGNYVQFIEDSTVFKVKEILVYGLSVKNETEATYIEFDQFSGIPLNEEILLKGGFENLDYGWDKILTTPDKTLKLVVSNGAYFPILIQTPDVSNEETSSVGLNYIKYLHQLQNLYFALTGSELELTL